MTKFKVLREEFDRAFREMTRRDDFIELEGEVVEEKYCNCISIQWPHQHTGPNFPFKEKTLPPLPEMPSRMLWEREPETMYDTVANIIRYLKARDGQKEI